MSIILKQKKITFKPSVKVNHNIDIRLTVIFKKYNVSQLHPQKAWTVSSTCTISLASLCWETILLT